MPIPHPQASNHAAASGAPPSAPGLLRNSTLFRHLDDSEADAILADAQVRHYPEGAQIFAKGDPGDSMMAVLHGRVALATPPLTVVRWCWQHCGRVMLSEKWRFLTAKSAVPVQPLLPNATCWSCGAIRF